MRPAYYQYLAYSLNRRTHGYPTRDRKPAKCSFIALGLSSKFGCHMHAFLLSEVQCDWGKCVTQCIECNQHRAYSLNEFQWINNDWTATKRRSATWGLSSEGGHHIHVFSLNKLARMWLRQILPAYNQYLVYSVNDPRMTTPRTLWLKSREMSYCHMRSFVERRAPHPCETKETHKVEVRGS